MAKKSERLTLVLTAVYIALVVWIILFKMSTWSELAGMEHIHKLNLIPFHYDDDRMRLFHINEVVNNIAIFIPLGIYFKMLKLSNIRAIAYGAGLSLILEALQYIFGIGAADITDLLTNTFGTAVGVGIYCALAHFCKNREKLNKVLNILALIATILLIALIIALLIAN